MAKAKLAGLLVKRTTDDECGCEKEAVARRAGAGVCSTRETVALVADIIRKVDPRPDENPDGGGKEEPQKVIEKAKKLLSCNSEACVSRHPKLEELIQKKKGRKGLEKHRIEHLTLFKIPGERNGPSRLSNFEIDRVLTRWAYEFKDFFNCPFAMFDFEREPYLFGEVSMPDVYQGKVTQNVFKPGSPAGYQGEPTKRPCRTFGCVLNTDVTRGPGKHWVCVFVDMREDTWTIEYFNSSGNPPPRAVLRWMTRTRSDLEGFLESREEGEPRPRVKTEAVTAVTHQRSKTECGVYTLYYIRARLEGVPYAAFKKDRVTDDQMIEFRKHLFVSEKDM